eukprot:4615964-Pleurochrysis_carterae.AAC.2
MARTERRKRRPHVSADAFRGGSAQATGSSRSRCAHEPVHCSPTKTDYTACLSHAYSPPLVLISFGRHQRGGCLWKKQKSLKQKSLTRSTHNQKRAKESESRQTLRCPMSIERAAHLREQLRVRDKLSHRRAHRLLLAPSVRFDHGQRVPEPEARLQEDARADTAERALTHHRDPVSEQVGLVHVVSRQNQHALRRRRLEQVPQRAS